MEFRVELEKKITHGLVQDHDKDLAKYDHFHLDLAGQGN